MPDVPITTEAVVRLVDNFIDSEFRQAASNPSGRAVLDYSGRFLAHQLGAQVYAAGWQDGSRVTDIQLSAELRRGREEARHQVVTEGDPDWTEAVKRVGRALLSALDEHSQAEIDPAIAAAGQQLAVLIGWTG